MSSITQRNSTQINADVKRPATNMHRATSHTHRNSLQGHKHHTEMQQHSLAYKQWLAALVAQDAAINHIRLRKAGACQSLDAYLC
jgi:hypothetical protein